MRNIILRTIKPRASQGHLAALYIPGRCDPINVPGATTMSHTLKLKGDISLPGLALPAAFATLDSRLESVMQLSMSKGSSEAQVVGLITVCEELKQLLKCAFIENGMLASRIEILTRYQMESSKKMEKKVNNAEVENKVTRKHMKRLRKRLNAQLVMQRKKDSNWWDVTVQTTDYDSFVTLSRAGGYPDLEFMLRVNQLMIDFVGDSNRTELLLPPMGLEERQEVSKLASIYKLRCRYGKSVQIAPSTLLKARQACVPAPGEVDTILNNFARSHVQRKASEEIVIESTSKELISSGNKEERAKPLSIPLPSTMLTPISSLPSPTVDISSLKHSSHSPPSSALTTPTAIGDGSSSSSSSVASRFLKQQRDGLGPTANAGGGTGTSGSFSTSVLGLTDRKSSVATQSANLSSPVTPNSTQRPHPLTTPHLSSAPRSVLTPSGGGKPLSLSVHPSGDPRIPTLSSVRSSISGLSSIPSPSLASSSFARLPLPTHGASNRLPPASPSVSSSPHPSPLSPVGIVLTPLSAGATRSPGGGVLVQSQIRGPSSHQSTVLAHPIKCPTSPTSQMNPDHHQQHGAASLRSLRKEREREGNGKKRGGEQEVAPGEEGAGGEVPGGGGGSGSARTDSMGPPVKRVRVTRRSAAEEELAKQ